MLKRLNKWLKTYNQNGDNKTIPPKVKVSKIKEYHKMYTEGVISYEKYDELKCELIYN